MAHDASDLNTTDGINTHLIHTPCHSVTIDTLQIKVVQKLLECVKRKTARVRWTLRRLTLTAFKWR